MKPTVVSADVLFEDHRDTLKWQWVAGLGASERRFDEVAVREALLNAITHRDYRLGGSIFVRQYPQRMEIVSPGGFPPGITPLNVLDQQNPRNRRLAEAFAKCGLIERSGQGVNLMFEMAVRQGNRVNEFVTSD